MSDDIKKQVEKVLQEEAAALADPDGDQAPEIDFRFVRQCLNNNERGDGILFASMMRDLFVFNKTTENWLRFNGHHWDLDKMHAAHASVEQIALKYVEMGDSLTPAMLEATDKKDAAERLAKECLKNEDEAGKAKAEADALKHVAEYGSLYKQRKALKSRANRLRALKGAKAALEFSHKIEQPLAIEGDELDMQPMLLPCANGVIDLETGKLFKGDPEDYLMMAVPCEYHGTDVDCQPWDDFMLQIHQGDADLAGFVKRLLGYSITGLTREHFIATFVGEGRNGKGTMFETLQNVLGNLAWTIQPEMILEQKNAKSSGGPSADLIALMGKRIVIASETDENRKISGSRVKSLTGGDTICARSPHDKYDTNFVPTHTLFLQTNHIPKGLTRDFALLKRLLFINYPLKFVDDPDPEDSNQKPRDAELKNKLLECRSGILGWLVQGCLEWQRDGLNPPARIKADIEKLRHSEDVIGQFIEACCQKIEPDKCTTFAQLYESFVTWFKEVIDENGRGLHTKKGFGIQLDKKGYRRPQAKETSGTAQVYGLGLAYDDVPFG